jgi:hypothetical protein
MFKIQNKSGLVMPVSLLVIDISVIRICFAFRYSDFGFPRLKERIKYQVFKGDFIVPIQYAELLRRGTRV